MKTFQHIVYEICAFTKRYKCENNLFIILLLPIDKMKLAFLEHAFCLLPRISSKTTFSKKNQGICYVWYDFQLLTPNFSSVFIKMTVTGILKFGKVN